MQDERDLGWRWLREWYSHAKSKMSRAEEMKRKGLDDQESIDAWLGVLAELQRLMGAAALSSKESTPIF